MAPATVDGKGWKKIRDRVRDYSDNDLMPVEIGTRRSPR